MKRKIVVLGPRGTYGHEAALKAIRDFCLGSDCEIFFVEKMMELERFSALIVSAKLTLSALILNGL